MRTAVWIIFCVLFVLHHDGWWWDDGSVVLGFLPIGLAWHTGFSIAAALLWLAATRFAWPDEVEAWAEEAPLSEPENHSTPVANPVSR